MPYELRCSGSAPMRFEDEHQAMAEARRIVQQDPAAELELIDLATGQPASPGASKTWREELKNQIGF